MPRFGLRREEIEEKLGLPELRARQNQFGWQLNAARSPYDLAQAEGGLAAINGQIALLESLADIIEQNNQQILSDLQRLLGVTRRPAGSPPPRVTSAAEAVPGGMAATEPGAGS